MGARHLAPGIAESRSLAAIYLDSNTLHDDGVRTIMAAVESNHDIMVARMDGNDASDATMAALQDMLGQRKAEYRPTGSPGGNPG